MKSILLCAGFGTRLYPLTRDTAKPLLEVAGKPIVEHLADQLAGTGHVDEVIVVSNGRFFESFRAWAECVSKRLPDIRFEVLNDGALDNEHRLGTVRDLFFAVEHKKLREPTLVAAGDNLYRFSLESFIEDYSSNPRNLVLAYRETDRERLRRTGVAEFDPKGRILELWEKPEEPASDWACPALYILEASALECLSTYLAQKHAPDAIGHFIAWLVERQPVFVHEMKGARLDIGNIESYRSAESWLKEME